MKFRKKAHRIGDDEWADVILEGVNQVQIVLHLGRDGQKRVIGHVDIHKLEGTIGGEVGDWIIKSMKDELAEASTCGRKAMKR